MNTVRRNPDLIGDLIVAGAVVGVAIVGARALKNLKIFPDSFDPAKVLGEAVNSSVNDILTGAGTGAGNAVSEGLFGGPSGPAAQPTVNSMSESQLAKNWADFAASQTSIPLLGITYPSTLNGLVDQWYNESHGFLGSGVASYNPTSWKAFHDATLRRYYFLLPDNPISYFNTKSAGWH